jgi:hypothetical protein
MPTRVLFPILALFVAGCMGTSSPTGVGPTATPVSATSQPSAQVSPTAAAPTASTCEPGADGSFQAVVLGTANIFSAGHDAAPAPGGGGAGTPAAVCELPAGSTAVTFPAATGEVSPFTDQPLMNGPAGDRLGAGGSNTDVTSYRGISGIINRGNGMFLVGVFLAPDEPADPAPDRLDFTGAEAFEELTPKIAQTFLVGDGLGRRFIVPPGATRLFLGFADAFLYEGAPGWYGNNGGHLEVTVVADTD